MKQSSNRAQVAPAFSDAPEMLQLIADADNIRTAPAFLLKEWGASPVPKTFETYLLAFSTKSDTLPLKINAQLARLSADLIIRSYHAIRWRTGSFYICTMTIPQGFDAWGAQFRMLKNWLSLCSSAIVYHPAARFFPLVTDGTTHVYDRDEEEIFELDRLGLVYMSDLWDNIGWIYFGVENWGA